MAIINKTGITTGGTIEAEHITRAIDALSGGSTDTVVATGSFQGTLSGTATTATTASYVLNAVSSSFATTATTAQTASYVLNAVSSSFATTASFALNASGTGFPYTGSARITGSLFLTGSFRQNTAAGISLINSDTNGTLSLNSTNINVNSPLVTFNIASTLDMSNMSKGGGIRIPLDIPGVATNTGSMYFDTGSLTLYICYDGTNFAFVNFGT